MKILDFESDILCALLQSPSTGHSQSSIDQHNQVALNLCFVHEWKMLNHAFLSVYTKASISLWQEHVVPSPAKFHPLVNLSLWNQPVHMAFHFLFVTSVMILDQQVIVFCPAP